MQIKDISGVSFTGSVESEPPGDIVALAQGAGLALGKPREFSGRVLDHYDGSSGLIASSCVEIPLIGADGEVSGVLCHTDWRSAMRKTGALRPQEETKAIADPAQLIVHDINNILAVIASGLRLLEHRNDADYRKAIVGKLQDAIARGAMLSRQMLDSARQRRQSIDGSVAGSRLAAMARTLDRALHPDITVRTEIDSDLWAVNADSEELYFALLNLCRNSADAMADGGVITVAARNVESPTGTAGGFVEIVIADDGMGMSEEVLSQAVTPYFTTKPTGSGSGLGLSQVQRFAETRGGAVRIESELGVGTAVRLFLPRAQANALPGTGGAEIRYTSSPDGGVFHVVNPAMTIPTL